MSLTPGLHLGIDEQDYHALPGLSSTGAKAILDCPARYRWQRDHPVQKDIFDKGSIAHALILRSGDTRIRVAGHDVTDWRKKEWQQWKAAHRAAGLVPILRSDLLAASKMAAAVRRHRVAGAIFSEGQPEVSLSWTEATEHGEVTCRGRLDWLRDNAIVDLKTISRADDRTVQRQALDYGYAQQADFYQRGYQAITGDLLPFVHVVVEKEPPHIVRVIQLSDDFLAIGRERNERALALFAECTATDTWPAYGDDITPIYPPRWA